jgi:hypothetical protein
MISKMFFLRQVIKQIVVNQNTIVFVRLITEYGSFVNVIKTT